MNWTPKEIAALRAHAAAGETMAGAAASLGRTHQAVANKASTLGVSFGGKIDPIDPDAALRQRWVAILPSLKDQLRADCARIMAN